MSIPDVINDFLARYDLGGRSSVPIVTVLRLNGVIGGGGVGRRGLSLAGLEPSIKKAFSKRARAVCLLINSPGGSPVQSAQIASYIRHLSQEKKTPVFAFAEDVAASGGYWLSLAADEIYADPMSVVGSIGVISAGFGFQGLMERIGVERRVHAQGNNKSLLDPFQPEDPEGVKRLTDIQSDMHRQFIGAVKQRRGDRLVAEDDVIFNGDIWTGERALELGLVDGLGDMRTIVRRKYGPDVRFLTVRRPMSWLERRFGRAMSRESIEQDMSPSGWASDLIAAVEDRALWARFGL
jgi:signal peptide peptidase SppA